MTTDHNLVISLFMTFHRAINSIDGVIVDVVASIVVNGGFEHRWSQTKCYNIMYELLFC
jgi:hypothetical protein